MKEITETIVKMEGQLYPVDLRVVTQAEIEKFKKETGINGYSESQREKH